MLKKIITFLFLFFIYVFSVSANLENDEILLNFFNTLREDYSLNSEESSFFIDFQRPSYLLNLDENKSIFICDMQKDECKINFNLVDKNKKSLSKYKYICKNNF
jgi:hypothetical protein